MSENPAIAIAPYGTKFGLWPGRLPLDAMHWPLGQPERLCGGVLGDMAAADHLITYPCNTIHYRPFWGVKAQLSVMVLEPSVIHARHLRALRRSHGRFFRVLSYNDDLLAAIPNGIFLTFGTTWVPQWRDLDVSKTRMVSLIASAKRSQEGHELRHATVEWAQGAGLDVDVMGRGYMPFERKAEGLASYRFSVVIENTRERNYFSEKLLDAVLCETVPIYWGCPNIGDFMDTDGMILCESEADLRRAVMAASEAEYAARLPALRAIKGVADSYGDVEKRAAQSVLDSL